MPPTERYERYAAIYDLTGQDDFSLWAWQTARVALDGLGWRGWHVLELACGTGAAAEQMAREGLHVVAVDLSRPMLLEACQRARHAAFRVVRSDMRQLGVATGSFDLVTSFYDSFNYLLDLTELEQTLREVARVLRPGGCLAFDLNTPFTLREHWTGLCHAQVTDELGSIWYSEWLEPRQVSSLRASFFVRGDDGRYDRFDEVHDERGFTEREIEKAAKTAKLKLAHVEDMRTGRRPGKDSRRNLYVLRRA